MKNKIKQAVLISTKQAGIKSIISKTFTQEEFATLLLEIA